MKQIDKHGDGIVPKFDFIKTFHNQNCHHALRIELIEKIVNIYINNDPNIIMIKYENLIRELCKDIKSIIDTEYQLFPIHKYKYSISIDNKRAISQNMFSRDTGNLNPKAISSLKQYNILPKISESDIRTELEKIGKISIFLGNNYKSNKMISYLELMKILERYQIYLNKALIVQLLKYLDIKNPNCFYISDFVNKVNKKLMNSTCFNFRKNANKNNILNNSVNLNNNNNQTLSQYSPLTEFNSPKNIDAQIKFNKTNIYNNKSSNNLKSNILSLSSKNSIHSRENIFNKQENVKNESNVIKNNMDSNLLNIKLIKINI
jgi:hypothetical protein